MRKLAFAIVLFAVCLIAREGAGLPAFANLTPSTNCYPDNLFSYQSGPDFTSKSTGRASFEEAEIEIPGQAPYDVEYGGLLAWRLQGKMSDDSGSFGALQPGTISGRLVIDLRWGNHTRTTFISRCIAEVQTNSGSSEKSFEMEFEGKVQGFPGLRPGTRDAVASIAIKYDTDEDKIKNVALSVELGTTCFEGDTEADETEFGLNAGGIRSGSTFSSQDEDAGAFGLPIGFDPNIGPFCPGFG